MRVEATITPLKHNGEMTKVGQEPVRITRWQNATTVLLKTPSGETVELSLTDLRSALSALQSA